MVACAPSNPATVCGGASWAPRPRGKRRRSGATSHLERRRSRLFASPRRTRRRRTPRTAAAASFEARRARGVVSAPHPSLGRCRWRGTSSMASNGSEIPVTSNPVSRAAKGTFRGRFVGRSRYPIQGRMGVPDRSPHTLPARPLPPRNPVRLAPYTWRSTCGVTLAVVLGAVSPWPCIRARTWMLPGDVPGPGRVRRCRTAWRRWRG